ncbi:neutral zinc metallopeptidase [Planococcus sp. YIM B11945]|uniref:neutral zinc metallopeptidase n=1 Tax=Planococcus sp. YIM B11945 TaxID=3435410 RepID=UPI003D7E2C6F
MNRKFGTINQTKGEDDVSKLPGYLLFAASMILLGACGPEEETTPAGNEEAPKSGGLELIDWPEAPAAEVGAIAASDFTTEKGSAAMTSYLEVTLNNVHNFWAGLMTQAGLSPVFVDYDLAYEGDAVETRCAESSSTGPDDAFYCAEDDLIVFANELAVKMWKSEAETNDDPEAGAAAGDLAVAVALAHEYAHALQAEIGWLPEGDRLVPIKSTELNADCLTGVWAYSTYSGGLERENVEAAMQTLADMGEFDHIMAEEHGTPQERTDAFMAGFESGTANSCDPFLQSGEAAR